MLVRLEVKAIPLVCEWDEDDGQVGVAMGGERERAWDMMTSLHRALGRVGGEWLDNEMTERIRPVCGVRTSALVWRAVFDPPESVVMVPEAIRAALGA